MNFERLSPELTQINPLRATMALILDWALIVSAFAVVTRFPSFWVYLLSSLLIARTQLALAVLMHESAHRTLYKSRAINDFVGQAFAAGPLGLSLFSYREGHLEHHRAPMTKDDPVAVVFQIGDYPVSRSTLIARLLMDLLSINYFITISKFARGHYKSLKTHKSTWKTQIFVIISVAAAHLAIFGVLSWVGHPYFYLTLWILPSLTFLQLFSRIRAITEHAGYLPDPDQRKNARTVVSRSWQTFFVGPHSIHYHIEHHQYVRVPFYHLREVHRLMKSQGQLPEKNLYRGYGQVLRDVTVLA